MFLTTLQIESFLGSPAMASGAKAGTPAGEDGFGSLLSRAIQAGTLGEGTKAPLEPGFRQSLAEGSQWLQQFKAQLQVRGVDFADTAVAASGLTALLPMLSAAGFDTQAVAGLFEELQAASGAGEVRLTDLFAGLEDVAAEDAGSSNAEMAALSLSSLPYLETVLGSFGMAPADIDQVVAASKVEGEGMALGPLVDALQNRLEVDPELARRVPDEQTRMQTAGLMDRMGLTEDGPGMRGALNLEQFVARLEKLAGQPAGQSTDPADLAPQIDRFLEGCRSSGGQTAQSPQPAAGLQKTDFAEAEGPTAWSSAQTAGTRLASSPEGRPAQAGATPALGPAAEEASAKPVVNEASRAVESLAAADTHTAAPTAASAGAGTATAERSLPAYLLNQVERQIVRARLSDASEIRFQLKPPHLGRIQMTIDQGTEGLKVNIIAEHQAARDMLLAHTADLRTALQDQGIQLDKVDVQVSYDFDQTMADSRQESQRSWSQRGRIAGRQPEGRDADRGGVAPIQRGIRDNALYIVA